MLRTLVSALKAMFFGKSINNTKLLLKQEKRDSYFIFICLFVFLLLRIWKKVFHMIRNIFLINWRYSRNVNDTLEANVMCVAGMENIRSKATKISKETF